MSAHSAKARGRHPDTTTVKRTTFRIGHIAFEVIDHPENGITYGLRAAVELPEGKVAPLLFSGHLERGMGTQLRRLAHHFDDLEAKL